MRISRSNPLQTLHLQPHARAHHARREALRQQRDTFEQRRATGPALTPPQPSPEEVLAMFARRVAAQPATTDVEAPRTGGLEPQPTPVGLPGDEGSVPTPVSSFSPIAPPGVVDPRVPVTVERTEKRADTFPPQQPGESLAQYAMRTASVTGFDINTLGALLGTAGSLGEPNASFAEKIDRFLNPNAYLSQAEIDRANNLIAADRTLANRVYTGPVPVSSLTDDDRRYLMAVEQWQPGVGDLFHRLLSGSHADIARCVNDTAYNLGTGGFDVAGYRGQLRPLVEKVLAEKGLPHP